MGHECCRLQHMCDGIQQQPGTMKSEESPHPKRLSGHQATAFLIFPSRRIENIHNANS